MQYSQHSFPSRHPPRPPSPLHHHYLPRPNSILAIGSLPHSTFPPTSATSSNVSPNLTIPVLNIRGSIATVLYTSLCVAGLASKRMMKWWPLSCLIWCFFTGFVRRKGPQLVMPRTTPPEERIREPAVRAMLQGGSVSVCTSTWEPFRG